jgi:hypothetical protein
MFRRDTVTAPNGSEWEVGRRWMNRPAPKLFRREHRDDGGAWSDLPDADFCDGADDFLAGVLLTVAAVAVVALFVFVILPLLGFALELALLVMLFTSGIVGRVSCAARGSSKRSAATRTARRSSLSSAGAAPAARSPT